MHFIADFSSLALSFFLSFFFPSLRFLLFFLENRESAHHVRSFYIIISSAPTALLSLPAAVTAAAFFFTSQEEAPSFFFSTLPQRSSKTRVIAWPGSRTHEGKSGWWRKSVKSWASRAMPPPCSYSWFPVSSFFIGKSKKVRFCFLFSSSLSHFSFHSHSPPLFSLSPPPLSLSTKKKENQPFPKRPLGSR